MSTESAYDMSADAEVTQPVRLTVNGVEHRIAIPGRRLLSDALRHDLGLTGTHVGCEHGVCGACTVLLDGRPVRSCLTFAAGAQRQSITTVEGIGNDPENPSAVQQAFIDSHALQCGFCTPGFITTIEAYLEENPDPTPAEAREAISGNLCRCTGYQNIVKAVCRAAELKREAGMGESGCSGCPVTADNPGAQDSTGTTEASQTTGTSGAPS